VSASFRQRQIAADALRAGRTQAKAALAAVIGLSTLKRWLKYDSEFQAMVASSPDVRPGPPPRLGGERGVAESRRDLRCRLWVTPDGEVLGSYIPPAGVVMTHIEESDGLSYDDLLEVEQRLRERGINLTFAFDTLTVDV
jgi:hypothetical protein